jgi:outer membrane receptor protein involved in Fe transport
VALTGNGVDVPLPAADVRVKEKRAELFATATWNPAPALSVETGVRFETSRLTQSGDSALVKSLSYWKPRLLATWAASPRDRLHLLVEREVGQLDFADFVSEPSLTSGTITAGNRDLEPDSLWRAELAWEHHVGAGSIVLTGRHEWVRDVVDRIPVVSPEGVFDSVGNIGGGTRDEIQLDANLPLDGIGLPGVTINGSGLVRRSRVTDPQTGVTRRISEDLPIEATASLTHDLPALHLRWGVNYAFRTVETEFKIGEVQRDRLSDRVDAFIEYKPDTRWTIRLFGKNLTNSPAVRTREIYAGLRGGSALDYREERVLRSGRYFGINVQRTFGR